MARQDSKGVLINGLREQADILRANARRMRNIYGEQAAHHLELDTAAAMTDQWIAQIKQEVYRDLEAKYGRTEG